MDKASGKNLVFITLGAVFGSGCFGGGLSGSSGSLFDSILILELALEHAAARLVENESVDLLDDFEIFGREALSEVRWELVG